MSEAALAVVANAVVLGFRHGIDWDHIAALMDITASSTFATGPTSTLDVGARQTLWLSCLYAFGHCAIVIVIGIFTCFFAGFIPAGFDQIMERVVGLTLVVFGAVVFLIFVNMIESRSTFVRLNRTEVINSVLKRVRRLLQRRTRNDVATPITGYVSGHGTAFGLGIVHGAGVETASQIMLIAALGASANEYFAICCLAAFSFGFIVSIMLITILTVQGIRSTTAMRSLYLMSTLLTALFSTAIGTLLLTGNAASLPELSSKRS